LVNALNTAVRAIIAPGDHAAAAEMTAEWDRGVLKPPTVSGNAGVLTWLQVTHRGVQPLPDELSPSIRLAGSMRLPTSATRLFEFLESAMPSGDGVPPVFWLPAEHAGWGRSATMIDVIRQMKGEVAPERGVVLLARGGADDRARRELIRQYGPGRDGRAPPLFDACVLLPTALPLSLELIVQPGRWAVALIHVPAPKTGFPVPLGYASANLAVSAAVAMSTATVSMVAVVTVRSPLWAAAAQSRQRSQSPPFSGAYGWAARTSAIITVRIGSPTAAADGRLDAERDTRVYSAIGVATGGTGHALGIARVVAFAGIPSLVTR